ncbi:tetratricopeptide repeat protein [Novosphingobium aquae]|uniref:Tetratricopeptide repeat protein n=1 Tax=Novosphingobium aquae TaxID=3133435 RepID=A0ABU8SE01_9SPHN
MTRLTEFSAAPIAIIAATIAGGLVLPMPAFGQASADRTLSDVRVDSSGNCPVLTVNFNMRLQVLSSFPETHGRELHIRIQPLDSQIGPGGRESLRPPSALPGIASIQYEGDNPGGPVLSLFFAKDTAFAVEPGLQANSVIIRLSDLKAGACPSPREVSAPTLPAAAIPLVTADGSETARLIDSAEGAIRDGENDRAIQLLTNALAQPENANTPRALELLGLTREKKGQSVQAQAEYEEYLRRYPSGEGAERVRQRLAALSPAAAASTPALRQASGRAGGGKAWEWGVRGSFSQFYFRDQGRTSSDTFATNSTLGTEIDNSLNVNQLLTSADVTISSGNDRQQFQLRGAGSYTKNFGTSASVTTINNGGSQTTFRSKPGGGLKALTALYLDWSSSDFGSQVRVGRQTRNSQGVLGRFDGALIGWQARPKLRVNVVGGFPVQSSRQTWVMKERPFYGVSVDLGNKKSPIQTTFYYFDQHARGGFVDRRSVGFEGRYANKKFNAFTMIDYDVKFNRLNLGLASLSYNFPDSANLTLTADYRQSPLLTTTNATYGQILVSTGLPVLDLRDLKPFFTDPQIYQMAKDTTLTAKTVTLAYSRPLTKKLQANFDVSMTDTGGTVGVPPTADIIGVAPTPVTGKEYYYGAQLIGSGLFWDSDIFIVSGRYANTQRTNTWTADINARVPITNKFRLSPRLRYGERKEKLTQGDFSQFQPTLRMNWYPLRHGEVEVEFGGNFSRQRQIIAGNPMTTRESGYVLSAGYRLDF